MRYYIECFYADGTQILGNLDGQASLDCRDFRRTNAFKRVKRIVGNPNHMGGIVAFARVVDASGKVYSCIGDQMHWKPVKDDAKRRE